MLFGDLFPLILPPMGKESSKEYLKKFGANILALRQARGLSLRKLAALCNVDHSDIAKAEKGQTNITILTLRELAQALEVHPKKLLDLEE
jgi:transcriptional regulator with XRE-family HTH domain